MRHRQCNLFISFISPSFAFSGTEKRGAVWKEDRRLLKSLQTGTLCGFKDRLLQEKNLLSWYHHFLMVPFQLVSCSHSRFCALISHDTVCYNGTSRWLLKETPYITENTLLIAGRAGAQCILDVHDASVPGAVRTQSSRAIIHPGFQSYQAETACAMESGNPGTGSGHDWTNPSWGPSCTVYGADTIAWYCDWKPVYLTSQTQMHSRPTLPEITGIILILYRLNAVGMQWHIAQTKRQWY